MTKSINVKIQEDLYGSMGIHEEINWSGVIRSAIKEKLKSLEDRKFDKERARKAFNASQKLLAAHAFSGRPGTEIIREWRDKRK